MSEGLYPAIHLRTCRLVDIDSVQSLDKIFKSDGVYETQPMTIFGSFASQTSLNDEDNRRARSRWQISLS